ncbi:phosphoribosyltransferase family protein [Rhodohalobacter sp.]|uniref:phosphoribosyltransferase family protein n=1 Tax=Rhodohalobacter sp. TaxID=1974210 RepID=UPI002ACE3CFC|nr:phosphoribosyltransferase family protein [Rhodohalobacter sp.]MDZ7758380.1 phosphoribosyltransferase family protein [Rhodohalobacter sp.]
MILSDRNRIERTVRRMAYQIVEEAHGKQIQLIGLNERGFALAEQLCHFIKKGSDSPVYSEQLWAHSDDSFTLSQPVNENTVLVIVDDVIFSGETILKGLDKITGRERFDKIFVSVLVDRGHRKYPIEAAVIGMNIPTKLNEQITVSLKEGVPDSIVLTEN